MADVPCLHCVTQVATQVCDESHSMCDKMATIDTGIRVSDGIEPCRPEPAFILSPV